MSKQDFLPPEYSVPASNNNYMRLQDGANRFRVLSKPIIGYEWWVKEGDSRKPVRVRTQAEVPNHVHNANDAREREKHFWAFVVWNYADEALQILELAQVTIMRNLEKLINDADYGAPFGYDIDITRDGKELNTQYTVTPKPPKPVSKEIQEEYDKSSIKLEALFRGEDPFAESNSDEVVKTGI